MPLRFTLDDATAVQIDDADIDEVYDQLWLLVPTPGAVTAAAKVRQSQMGFGVQGDALTAGESSALRTALGRAHEPKD